MTEMKLINLLDDLTDDEFKNFKWFLKKEQYNDIAPIKVNNLQLADRNDTVDLMDQKYGPDGTVQVMISILKKMSRNDLVKALMELNPGTQGPTQTPGVSPQTSNVEAEAKLAQVRTNIVDRVSEPTLYKVLDRLLERGVVNQDEMDLGKKSRADKARDVVDVVRRKGSVASSALIAALCEVDPCLSKELQLM